MLRPASPSSLLGLRRCAHASDAELDLALLRLGVLAPLDLTAIRACLGRPETRLQALTNVDGHRVIQVVVGGRPTERIHPDGRVTIVDGDATPSAA